MSRPRPIVLALIALSLSLGLLAVACGSSGRTTRTAPAPAATYTANFSSAEGMPQRGGTLAWGLEAESDSLSPVTARWALSGHMEGSAIFDPLATMDAQGHVVPYLATSWTHSPDLETWTFQLHAGVTFQDGEPFDAQAAVLNLNTYRSALITGKGYAPVTSVTATGPLTFVMKTNQPWADLPNVFLSQGGYMVAPKTLADPNGGQHPIGTGPFEFKEWVQGDQLTVVRNPHYWRTGLPYLDSIVFKVIPDAETRLKALDDGTVDAVDMVTAQQVAAIRADATLHRLEYNRGEELFAVLNTQQAPFDNIHARLALAYATDRDRLLRELGQGIYTSANGMFAPGQLGYTPDSGYPAFDLAKAKAEVAQYTAATGQPLSFTMIATTEIAYAQQDQLLEQMWGAAGIHVTLKSQDQAAQVISVVLGQYQAADFRLFGQPDPDADYYWWVSTSIGAPNDVSINMPRFATSKTDADLLAGRSTNDPAVRNRAYQAFERDVNAQVPYIWLARTDWVIASTPSVHGYVAAGNGSIASLGPKTWLAQLWMS